MPIAVLLVILSIAGTVQAAVTFTTDDTFAAPPIDGVFIFSSNEAYDIVTFVNSMHMLKNADVCTLSSSDIIGTSPTSTSSNSTSTFEPEKNQFSDESYSVLIVVCFAAVLVAVSVMIAVVELNQWRRRKITL